MTRVPIGRGALATVVGLAAVAAGCWALSRGSHRAATTVPASSPPTPPGENEVQAAETYQGFLYGRITTGGGAIVEGRLRFEGGEDVFWSDDFNGAKREKPWLAHVSPEQRPKERHPIEIFGFEIVQRERESKVDRPFLARFGDLAHIEARGDAVRVTLKSGTAFVLNRFDASDFDDGVRVWDKRQGVVDLDSLRIRTIELLKTPALADAPHRLHGTVRTSQGGFSGFIAWNRAQSLGSDELPRGQRPRLRRLSGGQPTHGQRHHPRRPPPRRPADLGPRRERDHRPARHPMPRRGLLHPLRPDRFHRAP